MNQQNEECPCGLSPYKFKFSEDTAYKPKENLSEEEKRYEFLARMFLILELEDAKRKLQCEAFGKDFEEEKEMTEIPCEEMILLIKRHIEVHKKRDARAVRITAALESAVWFIEKYRWHYPCKGDYPPDGKSVICCFEVQAGNKSNSNYAVCQQLGGVWYDDRMTVIGDNHVPIAWQYLPDAMNNGGK